MFSSGGVRAALPPGIKKHVWNLKYGLLGYPQLAPPEDVIRYLSPRLSGGSFLLELGCGRGSLLRGLRQEGWTGSYCGVDISKHAIRDAAGQADQRSSWVVSDIESFRSPFKWDAIVMIESIYYLDSRRLPDILKSIGQMLKDEGMLLVRLHDLERHREYAETLQRVFPDAAKVGEKLFCSSGLVQKS